jgi:sulfite exporter TauE/SafE
MQGFLLGLGNGATCVAYCTPVLVPYMLGEGKGIFQNYLVLSKFLLGRLAAYLIFACVAWLVNWSVLGQTGLRGLLTGGLYVIFSCLMILYAFFKTETSCAAHKISRIAGRLRNPFLIPLVAGLVSGMALCPPLLLALTDAGSKGSLSYSMLFFLMFFIGTSLFFVPIPFVGVLRRFQALRIIGRMAAGLVGFYYLYSGIIAVIAGMKSI